MSLSVVTLGETIKQLLQLGESVGVWLGGLPVAEPLQTISGDDQVGFVYSPSSKCPRFGGTTHLRACHLFDDGDVRPDTGELPNSSDGDLRGELQG